jgi:hypothetical protein
LPGQKSEGESSARLGDLSHGVDLKSHQYWTLMPVELQKQSSRDVEQWYCHSIENPVRDTLIPSFCIRE